MNMKVFLVFLLLTVLNILSACWLKCPTPKEVYYKWDKLTCSTLIMDSSSGIYVAAQAGDSLTQGSVLSFQLNILNSPIALKTMPCLYFGNVVYATKDCVGDNINYTNILSGIDIRTTKSLSPEYPAGAYVNNLFYLVGYTNDGVRKQMPIDSLNEFGNLIIVHLKPQLDFDSLLQFTFTARFSDNTKVDALSTPISRN